MANKFYEWCEDTSNVESATDFNSDSERQTGFIGGTPAKATKVNTALRQANLIACALADVLIPNDTTLNVKSSRSDVTTALNSALNYKINSSSISNRVIVSDRLDLTYYNTIADKKEAIVLYFTTSNVNNILFVRPYFNPNKYFSSATLRYSDSIDYTEARSISVYCYPAIRIEYPDSTYYLKASIGEYSSPSNALDTSGYDVRGDQLNGGRYDFRIKKTGEVEIHFMGTDIAFGPSEDFILGNSAKTVVMLNTPSNFTNDDVLNSLMFIEFTYVR